MKELIKRLEAKFNIMNVNEQKNDLLFFNVEKKHAESCIVYLKEFEGFGNLTMISAVDYIEDDIFQLTYLLHSYKYRNDVGIRVDIDRNEPVMVSIHNIWAGAKVFQRELKEMFGVDFPGCPRIDDGFVLEGWDNIPPMRKDFDTRKYSDETYYPRDGRSTKDPTVHMAEKLYPVEEEVKKEISKTVRKK